MVNDFLIYFNTTKIRYATDIFCRQITGIITSITEDSGFPPFPGIVREELDEAIKGQDIVYANLAGEMDKMAGLIVSSMEKNRVKRLIFIASLGIYNEVPGAFGKWNNDTKGAYLVSHRKAADIIEASPLDYTIIRPAWLTDRKEVNYETTRKGEPFKGTEVSRKSVAAYITELIEHPDKDVKASIGLDKPGSEGDKPTFM